MKVYIIGAGPGAPDLLTLRGARLIETCPVVFYTGSLVPKEVIARARRDAQVYDSSGMDLEEITAILKRAHGRNLDVARVHTGDPSIFGSTAEQVRRMEELGIEYEIIPGVSSFTAAAAALGKELTLPELSQTIIITRAEGRTPMPKREKLGDLGVHQATLVLFLSAALAAKVARELVPHYGKDCPVAAVERASWPDQKIVWGTLGDIASKLKKEKVTRDAIIIVGRVLTSKDFADSRLYASDFTHMYRKAKIGERR
ncbi:MAG: precorrin-4 C(11)-methyltransferase [Candidatus Omnitrophica bacterium]|nr:precorrin-4 C(11)-methyltransferase [Candidatus Omnitrophota bacterium]